MQNIVRRVAIVLSATALSVGLMGAPAEAAKGAINDNTSARDTGWR
jgi:hypothetical protein